MYKHAKVLKSSPGKKGNLTADISHVGCCEQLEQVLPRREEGYVWEHIDVRKAKPRVLNRKQGCQIRILARQIASIHEEDR
jgi:hypothetical protein